MVGEKKKVKGPVTQEKIFKIMMFMTFSVAAVFFLKNLLGNSYQSAGIIGICLAVFSIVIFAMKKMNISQYNQQFTLTIALVILVFLISANSGSYYSDDFPLFLALVALSGMYLEPRYTIVQMLMITAVLSILYIWHPEKADPLSQYIMCVGLFNVAAFAIYMVIKRGRAFIEMSMNKAAEAQTLLNSIKKMEHELNRNYEQSTERIHKMQEANRSLEANVEQLTNGSLAIHQRSGEVQVACDEVQLRMHETQDNIDELNGEVKRVEDALEESKKNMDEMDKQMNSINQIVCETNRVFALLSEQIQEISGMANQLSTIASTTKILALNASVEATRAGHYGAGFSVVASEVQQLATNSTDCSERVTDVVENMKKQIDITSVRLAESTQAITASMATLSGLHRGFNDLTTQFDSLYQNIEAQNVNIENVGTIFVNLKEKVFQMNENSDENRVMVDSIVDAITSYKSNMTLIVDDVRTVHELSASMLDVSQ